MKTPLLSHVLLLYLLLLLPSFSFYLLPLLFQQLPPSLSLLGCPISPPSSSATTTRHPLLPTSPTPHPSYLTPLLTLSLSPHIAPISRRLPAAPTRYSSLVLLQSPAQLSDPLPLPLPGPLIKACRTASPWAEERESTGWGDEGIGA